MPITTVSDYPTGYRRHNRLFPEWDLSVDGTKIGTVWETADGYAGEISGTNAEGGNRYYLCPEKPFRQAVIDRLAEMAHKIGIA